MCFHLHFSSFWLGELKTQLSFAIRSAMTAVPLHAAYTTLLISMQGSVKLRLGFMVK